MEPIKQFQLLAVIITGLKNAKETRKYPLYPYTVIDGENAQGKSCIADAVTFAFYGTSQWGEKSMEPYYNRDAKEISVHVRLVDGDGELHTLSRMVSVNGTTYETAIYYDKKKMRQADIAAIFGDKQLFLSLFNPLYFIERLAKDGRDFLLQYLPVVSDQDIRAQLKPQDRQALEGESLLDPNHYIKQKRAALRDAQAALQFQRGQFDTLRIQQETTQGKLEQLHNQIRTLGDRITELEHKKTNGLDMHALQTELQTLFEQQGRAQMLEQALQTAKESQYRSQLDEKIAQLDAKIQATHQTYSRLRTEAEAMKQDTICPLCHTPLNPESHSTIFQDRIREINDIAQEGRSASAERAALKEQEAKAAEAFEQQKQARIDALTLELQMLSLDPGQSPEELQQRLIRGNLSPEEYTELAGLIREKTELEGELHAICEQAGQAITQEEAEQVIRDSEAECARIEAQIAAAGAYNLHQSLLTFAPLQMNKAKLKLAAAAKSTGEIKEVFQFTYNGIDYGALSTSDKTRAGLEVVALLRRLSGRHYPVMIDNAESITHIEDAYLQHQVLFCHVEPRKQLTVNALEMDEGDVGIYDRFLSRYYPASRLQLEGPTKVLKEAS